VLNQYVSRQPTADFRRSAGLPAHVQRLDPNGWNSQHAGSEEPRDGQSGSGGHEPSGAPNREIDDGAKKLGQHSGALIRFQVRGPADLSGS
jgi:hypothetical protein